MTSRFIRRPKPPAQDSTSSMAGDLLRHLPAELAAALGSTRQSGDPVAALKTLGLVFERYANHLDSLARHARPGNGTDPQLVDRLRDLEDEVLELRQRLGLPGR